MFVMNENEEEFVDEFDAHLFGTLLADRAEKSTKVYALVTAFNNGMFDVTEELVREYMQDPVEVGELIFTLIGSFTGMIALFCQASNIDPKAFLASLATGNSQMLEVGKEIVRQVEAS